MDRELKGVWSLNQELQKSTSKHDPELRKAVDARNAAIRKTHHAWKVIRDLMEEKGVNTFLVISMLAFNDDSLDR